MYVVSFYRSQLEELKTLQKLRERPRGVNIISLAHGQKVSDEEDMLVVSSLHDLYIMTEQSSGHHF